MYAGKDNSGVIIAGTWLEKKWKSIVRICIFKVPLKGHCWRLGPQCGQCSVFRSGTVGRWLDPESSYLVNGGIHWRSQSLIVFRRGDFVIKESTLLPSYPERGLRGKCFVCLTAERMCIALLRCEPEGLPCLLKAQACTLPLQVTGLALLARSRVLSLTA